MSLDQCINKSYTSLRTYLNSPENPNKRIKITPVHTVPIVFVDLKIKRENNKTVSLRTLLDSGASCSVISEKAVHHLKKTKDESTSFCTMAGTFNTNRKCKIKFQMPELNQSAVITQTVHVTDMNSTYDFIIGRDLLHELGINLDFKDKTVRWNDNIIDMKPPTCTQDTSYQIDDSVRAEDATDRMAKIIAAKYEPADINKLVAENTHLTKDEQQKLIKLLQKHEDLLDGTLGKWKGYPYKI